jgi:hypothetical protein
MADQPGNAAFAQFFGLISRAQEILALLDAGREGFEQAIETEDAARAKLINDIRKGDLEPAFRMLGQQIPMKRDDVLGIAKLVDEKSTQIRESKILDASIAAKTAALLFYHLALEMLIFDCITHGFHTRREKAVKLAESSKVTVADIRSLGIELCVDEILTKKREQIERESMSKKWKILQSLFNGPHEHHLLNDMRIDDFLVDFDNQRHGAVHGRAVDWNSIPFEDLNEIVTVIGLSLLHLFDVRS